MSKAFTSEETEDASVPGRLVVRAAPGEERPITAEGHAAFVRLRDALVRERAEALVASAPDRDERLRGIDHRLALARATLESVRVVEAAPPDGVVRFGSTVVVREDGRPARRVRIVGPDEAEGTALVSALSPLGRALLGARRGSEVEVERPSGEVVFVVEAVE